MRQVLQEQLASWYLNHHGCSRATEALTALQTTQAAGMEDYVSKPVKQASVRAVLERWLRTTATPQAA